MRYITAILLALTLAPCAAEDAVELSAGEAEFVLIVYGERIHRSSKGLVEARKSARQKAVGLVSRFEPEGRASYLEALRAALSLGVPRGSEDLARAGIGDVDTIFVIGGAGSVRPRRTDPGTLLADAWRLRRVKVHFVNLSGLPKAYGEEDGK